MNKLLNQKQTLSIKNDRFLLSLTVAIALTSGLFGVNQLSVMMSDFVGIIPMLPDNAVTTISKIVAFGLAILVTTRAWIGWFNISLGSTTPQQIKNAKIATIVVFIFDVGFSAFGLAPYLFLDSPAVMSFVGMYSNTAFIALLMFQGTAVFIHKLTDINIKETQLETTISATKQIEQLMIKQSLVNDAFKVLADITENPTNLIDAPVESSTTTTIIMSDETDKPAVKPTAKKRGRPAKAKK